jgi:dTDP-4-amino-4,6-dideoxygalactose transaminase
MASRELSGFYGQWGAQFRGGPRVQAFEAQLQKLFGVPHAVSVNSATSGLMAAMGAIGVGPGDEVIVPPYTMSATAMAPLVYGALPVFADIEDETFGLDPEDVERKITPRTRAILTVNLFGHPSRLHELAALARRYDLALVEDNSQCVFARDGGAFAGTVGQIGVFSLNYHKHLQCGEGGFCLTRDDTFATRLQLIRNHAETAVANSGMDDLRNMIGFNLRMTELSAAIAEVQFERADELVGRCVRIGGRLTQAVAGLEGLSPPAIRSDCTHVYYVWALRVLPDRLGIDRKTFVAALQAEGFPCFEGYVAPLYRLPVFQKKIAYGSGHFPFDLGGGQDYAALSCPVTERMHESELVGFEPCAYAIDDATLDALAEALRKVHAHRFDLAAAGQALRKGA